MTIESKLKSPKKTDFGGGLVLPLVKFAEHAEAWLKEFKKFPGISMSRKVELFFNCASDHLYDIEIPNQLRGTKIEEKVNELQALALRAGHGFTGERWSEKDVIRAYDLCREIAMLLDKHLGLEPDLGKW